MLAKQRSELRSQGAGKAVCLLPAVSSQSSELAALNEFRNLFNDQDKELQDTVAQMKTLIDENESKDEFRKAA